MNEAEALARAALARDARARDVPPEPAVVNGLPAWIEQAEETEETEETPAVEARESARITPRLIPPGGPAEAARSEPRPAGEEPGEKPTPEEPTPAPVSSSLTPGQRRMRQRLAD